MATGTALAGMVGHKSHDELRVLGGVPGVLSAVGSDRGGIASSSVGARRERHGRNRLPEAALKTFMDFFWAGLEDNTLRILIGAAVVSLVVGMTTPDPRTGEVDRSTGWVEGAAILLSVFIVCLVTAVNDHQKQAQFAQLLAAETIAPVVVIRDGAVSEVASEDVVVGDAVMVYAGMSLSFDALLLEGVGFTTNEANVTGEMDDIHKSSDPGDDCFLISGTHIVDGCDGLAVVVAVGSTSFSGAIAIATADGKKDTPLQEKLEDMANLIGKFGLAAAVFTFGVLFLKELWAVAYHGKHFYAMKLFENLTTAVAIVVVAVPEGLPLSVTISLAYSMKQMLTDKNLVRHLAACETMGGATCICTDKTGTLTSNDMRVVALYCDDEQLTVDQGVPLEWASSEHRRELLCSVIDGIALNYNTAYGNKTSQALRSLCVQLQSAVEYDGIAAAAAVPVSKLQRFAFSSQRKRASVVITHTAGDAEETTISHYVVGAAELVLRQCSQHFIDGRRVALAPDAKERYSKVIEGFASQGYRTLCLAVSQKTSTWHTLPKTAPQDPLTVLAVVAIEEPVRPEVPSAILACSAAGIQVRMVTGDNIATALNVAGKCGITADSSTAMEGTDFRSLTDEELLSGPLKRLLVLARATPLDKRRFVELLREDPSAVLAVTGDGTNDAPALKAADVGFAMNSGSDIAKQASDIVLLDDNFVGVVKAVVWGRNVRDNIRKFLQFQLTVNTVACTVAFVGAVLNSQNLSPLKPVQLLWLNLIMDTFAALALATELPDSQALLQRQPEPREASIVTRAMVHNVGVQAAFQLVMEVFLLLAAHRIAGVPYFGDVHLTLVFNVFVLLQVFNFFNARLLGSASSLTGGLSRSKGLLYIVAVISVLQVFIVQCGGKFMATTPLSVAHWLQCTCAASIALPVGMLSRSASVTGAAAAWWIRVQRLWTPARAD